MTFVFNRQVEVFPFHTRQLGLEDDLILVLVDIDAGRPGALPIPSSPNALGQIGGKQSIHFLLQRSQVSEGVIPNNAHKFCSSFIPCIARLLNSCS